MELIIGSECMGSWGKDMFNYLLKKLNINMIVKYKNDNNCNIIIKSVFVNLEKEWIKDYKKYIYWSGEHYLPSESIYQTKKLYIITTIEKFNSIYIPFFLYSLHIYKQRISPNINRKYLLAYCSSRYIEHREHLFNLFVEHSNNNICHALGNCCGKYQNTKINKIGNGWNGEELINTYTNYKFVLAIENIIYDGYITEKIINAFYSGAIPIYYGCKKVSEFFNKKAFINVSDFNSFEDCVKYVINLDDETIKKMSEEPIYMDNEITNLLNDEWNSVNDNKTLTEYINKVKEFLE